MTASAKTLAPATTKAQALRSFDPNDFPEITGREEEWRFTPVERLSGLLSGPLSGDSRPGAPWVGGSPVFAADQLPDGVTLAQVTRDDPRIGSVLTPFDRLSALAFQNVGTASVLRIGPGVCPPEPLVLTLATQGGPTYGHAFVDVAAEAEATVVATWLGAGDLADNVEVSVADGATLTLVTVADRDPGSAHAQHLALRLGRDSVVRHVQVTLTGQLVRQYVSVTYSGPGGDCEATGLYFAGAGQHLEHRLLVDHSVPDCRSRVTYRGALQGAGARTVWVGDVLIRAEATGTDTYEINRNLVLSDGARADSVPNLEIETGEVAGAGHASAVGRFDDEHLFYLMARGIPEADARRLVVQGFFAEVLARVPVEPLRRRLETAIEDRLGEPGA